jgi:hypothetical protein
VLRKKNKIFSGLSVGSRRKRAATLTTSATLSDLIPIAAFLTPGISTLVYAYFKGKGNLKDGLSRLLTEVSQGYFQVRLGSQLSTCNAPSAFKADHHRSDCMLFETFLSYPICSGGVQRVHGRAIRPQIRAD